MRPQSFRYHLFRRLALALLALSMAIQPVLVAIGEVHALEHAALAAQHHGDLQHDGDHDHAPDPQDPDHGAGLHGLFHQTGCGGNCVLASGPLLAPMLMLPADLPLPDASPPARPSLTLPFRPPIT